MADSVNFKDFASEYFSKIEDTKEREVKMKLADELSEPITQFTTKVARDAADAALSDAGVKPRKVSEHERAYRNMLYAWKNDGWYPGAKRRVTYQDCAQADANRARMVDAGKAKAEDFSFSDGAFYWSNPMLIPKVIGDMVREPAEIIPTMTPLMKKLRFEGPYQSVMFPAASAAAFGSLDLAEGDPYPEATMEFGGTVTATMGKVGVMVRFTDEAIKYSQWDVMAMHLRAAGTALVRWKEQKCADHITAQGEVYFDNGDPVARHTTGRNSSFLYNGTFTMKDLLDMYGDMINDGYIPNTLLMNPVAWSIFAQDPLMRNWAYANGGMPWQRHQGDVGTMSSWLGQGGAIGSTEVTDPKQLQTTWTPVPGIFPYPLRIVVSPFIPFKASTSTTTIILCDSNELGILAVNEEATTEEFRDPLRDINSVKIKERYAIQVLNEGKAIRQAKNVIIARSWDVDDKIGLEVTGSLPTGEAWTPSAL
jgi:hypothetical protein